MANDTGEEMNLSRPPNAAKASWQPFKFQDDAANQARGEAETRAKAAVPKCAISVQRLQLILGFLQSCCVLTPLRVENNRKPRVVILYFNQE